MSATDLPSSFADAGNGTNLTQAQQNLTSDSKPPLYRFVFTGGPCGGKTTALARAFSFLRERGFEVITCPEAFTMLSSNGMSLDFLAVDGMASIVQGGVLDTQMSLENVVTRVLQARGKPAIILCDRGTMDGAVYLSEEEFTGLVEDRKTDIVQLRDNRYDAIFHLVTAADGAEHYYTLENNKVRTESCEEAIVVDKRTQRVWVGHPHLYVIDNSTDFEGKMARLISIMCRIVGLPSNLKRRSAKFLLRTPPNHSEFPTEIEFKLFEVEKAYLQRSDVQHGNYSFIRRRTNIDTTDDAKRLGSVFQITSTTKAGDEMIEEKRIITEREYIMAYQGRDPSRHVVKQRRISFLYNKQSFSIHIYEQPASGVCILHAQVEACVNGADEPCVDLPPFLNVERRLHDGNEEDAKYGAYYLSVIHE